MFYKFLEKSVNKIKNTSAFSEDETLNLAEVREYFDGFTKYISHGDIFYNDRHYMTISKYLPLMDFALMQLHDLLNHTHNTLEMRDRSLWIESGKNQYIDLNFVILTKNLFQNLFMTRKALAFGFEIQANILFRSYIELVPISLLFLLDYEFCEKYCTLDQSKTEEKQKWFNLTKPGKIKKRLKTVLDKHELLDTLGYHINNDWAENLYDQLSKSSHFNSSRFNLNHSYNPKVKGFKIDLLNNVSNRYKETLKNIIDAVSLNYIAFYIILKKRLSTFETDKYFKFRNELFIDIYFECLLSGDLYEFGDTPWK